MFLNNNKNEMDNEKEVWKAGTFVYPVPAVMVSCGEYGKEMNIITIAWTGTVNTNPAMTYISVRPERYSYEIIKKSGEFVINLTTKNLAKACDYCGVKSGRDTDKFKDMHLTPAKASHVKAPIIAESPVNIECKVKEIIPLGTHHMFIAEVLAVNVSRRYFDKTNKFCFEQTKPICYSHGAYYTLGEKLGTFGYSVMKDKTKKKKAISDKHKKS
jgi:flavin reductase (DIM6/NTAB) family NADH-FMN oxidoreductase RutF